MKITLTTSVSGTWGSGTRGHTYDIDETTAKGLITAGYAKAAAADAAAEPVCGCNAEPPRKPDPKELRSLSGGQPAAAARKIDPPASAPESKPKGKPK